MLLQNIVTRKTCNCFRLMRAINLLSLLKYSDQGRKTHPLNTLFFSLRERQSMQDAGFIWFIYTNCQQRSTSATLQACAKHPAGVKGGSGSATSLIVPTQASHRCCTSGWSKERIAARSLWMERCTSTYGPISHCQTVPRWYAPSRCC